MYFRNITYFYRSRKISIRINMYSFLKIIIHCYIISNIHIIYPNFIIYFKITYSNWPLPSYFNKVDDNSLISRIISNAYPNDLLPCSALNTCNENDTGSCALNEECKDHDLIGIFTCNCKSFHRRIKPSDLHCELSKYRLRSLGSYQVLDHIKC